MGIDVPFCVLVTPSLPMYTRNDYVVGTYTFFDAI